MPTETLRTIAARVSSLRAHYANRDTRMAEVQAVRHGRVELIAPDMFSDDWSRMIVANMVDTAARDTAAVLAPLPSFNCSAASGLSESAKKQADRRTKIARNYVTTSDFAAQMLTGADQYNTYGLLVLCIEPDFDNNLPRLFVEDAVGAYPVWNSKGETKEMVRVFRRDWYSLVADYPQVERLRRDYPMAVGGDEKVEVVKYVSDSQILVYLPYMGNFPIEDMTNPLGRCYYVAVRRPGLDEETQGSYDDVIWVQLARHRIQMLLMEGVEKAVRAPIAMPPDVTDLSLGPDAILQSQQGAQSIGRIRLDVPPQAFSAVEQLKQEQQIGSMNPEVRQGQIDASIITGRGVQQLQAGFNSQISVAQTVFRYAFRRAMELLFRMDEEVFGRKQKTVRGNEAGVPYEFKYLPVQAIAGDYTCDVSYGFSAGLDPNRAVVLLLQIDGAHLASKDYVRRNLPVDMNAVEEERKIQVEDARSSILLGMSGLAQSMPQIVASGGNPTEIIGQQAAFIKYLNGGKSVEEAAAQAFAPPPQSPAGQPQAQPPPGAETAPAAGQSPGGYTAGGFPQGLVAGQQNLGPGARPPLQHILAGLTSGGQPNLQASVSRRNPAQ